MKKVVWAQSPRAGLGNKILVWANALVFAEVHKLPLVTTNWLTIFIGPLLRREKSLRLYSGYFNEDSIFKKFNVQILSRIKKVQMNPEKFDLEENAQVIIFNKVMFWMHFFDNIRDHRNFVKESFYGRLVKRNIINKVGRMKTPEIGIHIRMGDFSNIKAEDKFKWDESTLERTPLTYFVEVIRFIREVAGKNIKVTVFSDGTKEELKEILMIEEVTLMEGNRDIEDLILLAKSKLIVTSASSTFGLLAGYFSDAVLIHHPNFFMRPVRDKETNKKFYEGPFKKCIELEEAIQTSFN